MKEIRLTRRQILKNGGLVLAGAFAPSLFTLSPLTTIEKYIAMTDKTVFDVIIIGGSYAGLSAALALGRSMRKVLIIDSGKPCNRQTPYSHNFLTQDGQTPKQISEVAKNQISKYDTVKFHEGIAVSGMKTADGFEIKTQSGESFGAKKLLFATGVADEMPATKGFAECWGISILHCPYCHGYEIRDNNIGIIANGETAFEMCRLINHWSKNLTLFTNGKSVLTAEQTKKIKQHHIQIIEGEISEFEHSKGNIQNILFKDGSKISKVAVFTRVGFKQHCEIPREIGCEMTEQNFIKVDDFNKTSIHGVFAAGDNTSMMRAIAIASSAGTRTGAFMNKELIDEAF
ncbi:MAG: NAD(P)/FAD-dependent oxidoreductase [Rhizobacter sp.]|nr:NAD(P)/FAD-dependent oxidoreductase [Chlorobiales bacterium]